MQKSKKSAELTTEKSAELTTLQQEFDNLCLELKVLKEFVKAQKVPANTHKQRASEGLSLVKMDYKGNGIQRRVRTVAQCMEDLYYQQGAISREAWEEIKGISYDSYGGIDDDELATMQDSEDEFEQSSFASYHDFTKKPPSSQPSLEVPNVETNKVDIAPAPNAPEVSPTTQAQGASELGGEK